LLLLVPAAPGVLNELVPLVHQPQRTGWSPQEKEFGHFHSVLSSNFGKWQSHAPVPGREKSGLGASCPRHLAGTFAPAYGVVIETLKEEKTLEACDISKI